MAEPRFKKTMEEKSGDKIESWRKREWPTDKRTKYLRLGYTKTARKLRQTEPPKRKMKKTKKKSSDCPGENQKCEICRTSAKIISAEELLKGGAETTEVVCMESACEKNCPGRPAGLKT